MSLTIQFLIILLAVFMERSASLCQPNDDCESDRKEIMDEAKSRSGFQNQTVHLYCVANSLYNTVGLNNDSLQVLQLSWISINKTRLNKIFGLLSYECKNYIKALSLKQHLQENLFGRTDTHTTAEVSLRPLYSVLVYLQTMADILDDIEFYKHGSRCVSLTEAEYKMMYYVQYDDDTLSHSLFYSAARWFDAEYYKTNLNSDSAPVICTCKILYPSL